MVCAWFCACAASLISNTPFGARRKVANDRGRRRLWGPGREDSRRASTCRPRDAAESRAESRPTRGRRRGVRRSLRSAAVRARRRRSASKSVAERTTAECGQRDVRRYISAKPVAANSARARTGRECAARSGAGLPCVVKLVGPQQQKFHAVVPRKFATTVRTTFRRDVRRLTASAAQPVNIVTLRCDCTFALSAQGVPTDCDLTLRTHCRGQCSIVTVALIAAVRTLRRLPLSNRSCGPHAEDRHTESQRWFGQDHDRDQSRQLFRRLRA